MILPRYGSCARIRKKLGEEHPDTLIALNNLSVNYGNLGDYQKEAELEEKLYALRCKVLGEEHLQTLNTLSSLAVTRQRMGKTKEALAACDEIAGARAELSEKVIEKVAEVYEENGLANKAEAFRRRPRS